MKTVHLVYALVWNNIIPTKFSMELIIKYIFPINLTLGRYFCLLFNFLTVRWNDDLYQESWT